MHSLAMLRGVSRSLRARRRVTCELSALGRIPPRFAPLVCRLLARTLAVSELTSPLEVLVLVVSDTPVAPVAPPVVEKLRFSA